MTVTQVGGALAALALALTACSTSPSSSSSPQPRPSPSPPAPSTAYDAAVLADSPVGFWPLRDVTAGSTTVADLSAGGRPARVVEGRLTPTAGPVLGGQGTGAAAFTGEGYVRTNVRDPFRPGTAFTVEMQFRADACTSRWTQVAGTGTYRDTDGRGGVNFLHYPQGFQTECHLAIEFWGNDAYGGGCRTPEPTVAGQWVVFAATYDGTVARCYLDGVEIARSAVTGFTGDGRTPFGIGASGDRYAGAFDSGSLAGVAVFARALPPDRLAAHAAAAR